MLSRALVHDPSKEIFAEPTALGLIGLAVGCAALIPVAFGAELSPSGLSTVAIFCLLFGGGGQLLAGLMNFANKNLFGGTIFTAFAFNWFVNYWALDQMASGVLPDHTVVLAVDMAFLVIFAVLAYGFGFFSRLLFLFLADIVALFTFRVIDGLAGTHWFGIPIAICTVLLAAISLWIAFALLINPTAGRQVFQIGGPLWHPAPPEGFSFATRRAIFDLLYAHWQREAFAPMPLAELEAAVEERAGVDVVLPDVMYLAERGGVALSYAEGEGQARPEALRLTADGIDVYEERVLLKV
jgi:uncharacterized protein